MLVAWYPLNGNLKDISGNHYDLNTNYLYGDVNQDGSITEADSQLILSYAAHNTTLTNDQLKLADVNKDGKADVLDSRAILKYIEGAGAETLVGKPSNVQRFNPTWVDGKTGRYALKIDQDYFATNWVTIEQLKNKHFEFSISLWVKQETPQTNFRDLFGFITHKESDNTDTTLRLESTVTPELKIFNNSHLTSSSGIKALGSTDLTTWVHLTIVFYLDKIVFYKNGRYEGEQAYQNSSEGIVLEGRFRLGNITESNYCNSTINNVKIYDHCLSKEEAYQDYLSPMLHYTFENPYAEETENIKHSYYFLGVTNGSDIKGDYLIKKSTDNWNMGLCLNDPVVYGGNYYTWSLEINSDTDLIINNSNELFDTNLITPTYTDVDTGRSITDYYKGGVPKNTWTRIWVTCYIKQESGMGTLRHVFCPKVPDGSSQIKVYYRNSMLEKKDHMTPYTRDRREGQLIRDVSGQGNDGKVVYKRERITINDSIYSNGCRVTKSGQNTFTIDNFSYNTDTNTRVNVAATLYRMPKNNRYHYVGSTISYEFDIKLESVVIESGETFASSFQGITYKSDGNQWIEGPVHVVSITQRLRNGTNSTYHITIEKQISNSEAVGSTVTGYDIQLRFDHIQSGKITVSNFYAYYQSLDTSTLGITDRNNAIGTHSAHFNGKNYIRTDNVTPLLMDGLTLNCWGYLDDWGRLQSPVDQTFIGNIEVGGFGIKSNNADGFHFPTYHKDIGYVDHLYLKYSDITSGWHMITLIDNKVSKAVYLDGELYRKVDHNSGKQIQTYWGSNTRPNPIFVGAELGYNSSNDIFSPSQKLLDDVYLNDIRLYPIALTADEVKALYRTKAKIDKDSNMYTNQLVETKKENMFICGNDPTLIPDSGLSKFMSNGTFTRQDRILTYTTTSITNPSSSGFYIKNSNYSGSLSNSKNKKFRYSFYIKVSSSGTYYLGEEYMEYTIKDLKAGKWYHIEKEGKATGGSLNFIFYKHTTNNDQLAVGDTISIKDIQMYRIDDDLLPIESDIDPKITKKAQIKGFELNEIDYDRLTKRQNIIEKDGAKWVEVFYHNTNNNTVWFTDEAEALHCTSQYKYSRLDCLEQYRQADGKFEFLLEYPEIPDQFNRWKQTDNPVKVEEQNLSTGDTVTKANGFESIHIDWDVIFGGLLKTSGTLTSALLNGVTNNVGRWWYAIGAYDGYTEGSTTGIPGPYGNNGIVNHSIVSEVKLYARISDEQINLGPTIINKYGAQWLEVFYHNNHSGTVLFADREEAMHTIGNKDKYSILDCLEQYRGKDNKFEFLLEYPTENPNQYNRWKQTSNPLETKDIRSDIGWDDSSIVEGCEPIHLDWLTRGNKWCGLISSISEQCLIDGTIGTNWHFAIGANTSYSLDGFTGIPGPIFKKDNTAMPAQNYIIQNDVHLYVRIDNINNRQQIAKLLKTGIIKTKEIKEV